MHEENHATTSQVDERQLRQMLKQTEYIEHLLLPFQLGKGLETNAYQFLLTTGKESELERNNLKPRKYQLELVPQLWQFEAMCTELFYFTFACLTRKWCIVERERALIFKPSNKSFLMTIKDIEQGLFTEGNAFEFYIKTINFILATIEQELRLVKTTLTEGKSRIDISIQNQSFLALVSMTPQQIDDMLKPLRSLVKNAYDVLSNQANQSSCKNCFIELEKCQFIRRNSVLYQIRSGSINVILYKHSKPQSVHKLKKAIENEKALIEVLKQMRKVDWYTEQEIENEVKKINLNFEKYVQESWVVNPVYIKVVQKGLINIQEQLNYNTESKFSFKIKVRYLTEKFMHQNMSLQKQMLKPTKPHSNTPEETLEYSIQFDYFRSFLCICLFSSIQIQYFNIDQLLQSWNLLVFEATGIELEIREKVEMLAKRKKCLVFKSTLNFHKGSPLVGLCLKTIDRTFAGYRVLQHIFRQRRAGDSKWKVELQQFGTIGKQINHYTSLICDLSWKLYHTI